MRTQWTGKGNRDAGSSCSCDRGLRRYLRNFGGGGGLNTPNLPSLYATDLARHDVTRALHMVRSDRSLCQHRPDRHRMLCASCELCTAAIGYRPSNISDCFYWHGRRCVFNFLTNIHEKPFTWQLLRTTFPEISLALHSAPGHLILFTICTALPEQEQRQLQTASTR